MTHSPAPIHHALLDDHTIRLRFRPGATTHLIPDLLVENVRLDGLSGEVLRLAGERHLLGQGLPARAAETRPDAAGQTTIAFRSPQEGTVVATATIEIDDTTAEPAHRG